MYDKADRAPKAGSLREALFLHVWLKRQEQRVAEVRVFAQGIADRTEIGKAFQMFVETIYPFAKDAKSTSDKKIMEVVEREVAKGAITFTPIQNNILRDAAKKYVMSDESVQKLRNAANRRKGLK